MLEPKLPCPSLHGNMGDVSMGISKYREPDRAGGGGSDFPGEWVPFSNEEHVANRRHCAQDARKRADATQTSRLAIACVLGPLARVLIHVGRASESHVEWLIGKDLSGNIGSAFRSDSIRNARRPNHHQDSGFDRIG